MKSSLFLGAVVFLLSLFIHVGEVAAAGEVKLWDTGTREIEGCKITNCQPPGTLDPGTWHYNFNSSLSFKNRANWKQVTGTSYDFGNRNVIIETDNYFFFLHSNTIDGPFFYPKYSDIPGGVITSRGHWGTEMYGGSLIDGQMYRNYHFNSIKSIIKNTSDEVILQVDAAGWGNVVPLILNKNITNYTFKNNFFNITAPNDYKHYMSSHSTGNLLVSISDENGTNDKLYLANEDIFNVTGQTGHQYFPNSIMIVQPRHFSTDPYYTLYVGTFKDMSAKPYFTWSNNRGYPIYEQFGVDYVNRNTGNNFAAFSILDNPNEMYKHIQTNTAISLNQSYTVPWNQTVPGKYRMIMRVKKSDGTLVHKTTNITNNVFTMTSPAAGTLKDVVLFLFDRLPSTPANVVTPMDVYREASRGSTPTITSVPTPTPTPIPVNNLTLTSGWNQISSPVTEGIDISTIENSCAITTYNNQKLWSWNAQTQSWINPQRVEPFKGYWINVARACTVTLSGTPSTFTSVQLYTGWNKISASGSLSAIKGACNIVDNWIWNWDAVNKSWTHPSTLQPDKGYWIRVTGNCTLD